MTAADAWTAILEDVRLYPSPHNSQPMKLRVDGAADATIFYDLDLGLPAESFGIPFGHVCAGVFLESLRVVAAGHGFDVHETLELDELDFEASDRLHELARIQLTPREVSPDDTAALRVFRERRTSRRPYDDTLVERAVITEIERIADEYGETFRSTNDPVLVKSLVHVNQATLFDDLQNDAVYTEIMHWLRFSKEQAADRGDGLSAEAMLMPGPILQFSMANRGMWRLPVVGGIIRRVYLNTMRGVRQLGWLEGPFDAPADYIEAGRTFMKVWLAFARHDVYLHPFGTVITNPRSHEQFTREADITEAEGRMAWMLFRFGHSKRPPVAHRRPASAMTVGATR